MKTEMNTVKVRKTEELEAEQLGAHIGEIVRLHGSIYKIRKMSSFAFVLLRTKRQMVQCVYEPAYARFALEELKEEACVRFTAEVIREERSRSGYDLHLLDVEILSEPEEVPPVVINQKRSTLPSRTCWTTGPSRCEMKKSARFSRFRPGSVRRSANFWMDSTSPKSTHRSS